jgi:hypothetical protein
MNKLLPCVSFNSWPIHATSGCFNQFPLVNYLLVSNDLGLILNGLIWGHLKVVSLSDKLVTWWYFNQFLLFLLMSVSNTLYLVGESIQTFSTLFCITLANYECWMGIDPVYQRKLGSLIHTPLVWFWFTKVFIENKEKNIYISVLYTEVSLKAYSSA